MKRVSGLYRPSNGTEGEGFMARLCDRCEHDRKFRETDDGRYGCKILAAAMSFYTDDARYPKEWVSRDDGGGTCTAFEPELSEHEREQRSFEQKRIALEAAGQQVFPFEAAGKGE